MAEEEIPEAYRWAEEGMRKYGVGAAAWLRRWKVNCQHNQEDLRVLDRAIEIVSAAEKCATTNAPAEPDQQYLTCPCCDGTGTLLAKDTLTVRITGAAGDEKQSITIPRQLLIANAAYVGPGILTTFVLTDDRVCAEHHALQPAPHGRLEIS